MARKTKEDSINDKLSGIEEQIKKMNEVVENVKSKLDFDFDSANNLITILEDTKKIVEKINQKNKSKLKKNLEEKIAIYQKQLEEL